MRIKTPLFILALMTVNVLAGCQTDSKHSLPTATPSSVPVIPGAQAPGVGNFAWLDSNQNGIQDSGEPGIGPIAVEIYTGSGTLYARDTTDAVTDTQHTLGFYWFNRGRNLTNLGLLPAGTYKLHFLAPPGYVFSPQTAGADSTTDSNPDSTGWTGNFYVPGNRLDGTRDAGLCPVTTIGDRVWVDANNNGIQDSGEAGKPGVTVELYTSANTLARTTTTDANGNYLFRGIAPGTYTVHFILPSGFAFSPENQGMDLTVDSNAGTNGYTVPITVAAGQIDLTWDAGVFAVPLGACCDPATGACTVTTQAACSGNWTINATCSPNPCAQPTGACCDPATGACTVTTQAACSGNWTINATCSPNPCAQPTGACCDPATGACTVTTQAACSGTWTINGTCSPNPCAQPTGACCNPATGACTVTTQAACSGNWTINGTCSPNPCAQPTGACCNPATGACTVTTQAACSGNWTINGTCSPNPCAQPTGACCNPATGACTVTTRAACSGNWTINGTCSPNPCAQPTGACCNPATGVCTVTTQAACSGNWTINGTCSPNPCAQPTGACCNPATGACTVTTQTACSGNWTINGTCSPNPCAQPTGACCNPATGACTVTTQAACSGNWTINGNCSPNPCAQPTGACCNPATGACTVTTQAACSGNWTINGTCSPNPCPQPTGACCNPATGACTVTTQAACSGNWTINGTCSPNPCTQPPPPSNFCTLTQGAYGNGNGQFNGERRLQMIQRLITPQSPLVLGKPGRSVTFADGSEECVIDRLPAGGPASSLPNAGDKTIDPSTCNTNPALPLQNGRFKDVLLGQVIALSLNTRLDANLGSLVLHKTMVTSNGQFTIPQSVLSALTSQGLSKTVGGLLELANRTLAYGTVGGASVTDVNSAADAINSGFDECATLISYSD